MITFAKLPISGASNAVALCFQGGPGVWCKLWKRETIRKNQVTFPNGICYAEDMVFCVHVAVCSEKVAILNRHLYFYNRHENSLTTEGCAKNVIQIIEAIKVAISRFPEALPEAEAEKIKRQLYSHACYCFAASKADHPDYDLNFAITQMFQEFPDDFVRFLSQNQLAMSPSLRYLLLSKHGAYSQRLTAFLKYCKYTFANWLAKKLLPHSEWLQETIAMHEKLKNTIERLKDARGGKV